MPYHPTDRCVRDRRPEITENDSRDTLLVLASREDPEAFGRLYDAYADRVFRFVRSRVRDRQNAEDVTAEVFFKALRGLDGYRVDTGSFAAWLFRIARNAVIDHERARRVTVPLDESGDHLDVGAAVEDQVIARVDLAVVLKELDRLPSAQRAALLLRLEKDLPVADIAVALERSEGAVRVLLHRGLSTLRRRLAVDPATAGTAPVSPRGAAVAGTGAHPASR